MLPVSCVGIVSAVCALLLTWLSAFNCAAQHDPLAGSADSTRAQTARSELANFSIPLTRPLAPGPRTESGAVYEKQGRPWLWLAASTTAALAATYVVAQGFSYKANGQASRSLESSNNLALDMETRMRGREQFGAAQNRADLLTRISDICLAGTVAATGATLLIWLTGKRKREVQQFRTLLGPMVLRGGGGAGGGLVLRNKF
jgi:hypothetical protein